MGSFFVMTLNFHHLRIQIGKISVKSLCLSVCLSVQDITFELLKPANIIFSIHIHLYNIYFNFKYQVHWIKVKVKWIKFHNSHNLIASLDSTKAYSKVKVI